MSYGNPPQKYGNPPQKYGNKPQNYGNKPQKTGNPPQRTGNPPQKTGNPLQKTGNPPQNYGNPPQKPGNPLQKTGNQQSTPTIPLLALKGVETILALVVLGLTRGGGFRGDDGVLYIGKKADTRILGYMVIFGFAYFCLAQLVGMLLGDKPNFLTLINAVCGGLMYIAVGALQAGSSQSGPRVFAELGGLRLNPTGSKFAVPAVASGVQKIALAQAAMAILTGLVFLGEAGYTGFTMKQAGQFVWHARQ